MLAVGATVGIMCLLALPAYRQLARRRTANNNSNNNHYNYDDGDGDGDGDGNSSLRKEREGGRRGRGRGHGRSGSGCSSDGGGGGAGGGEGGALAEGLLTACAPGVLLEPEHHAVLERLGRLGAHRIRLQRVTLSGRVGAGASGQVTAPLPAPRSPLARSHLGHTRRASPALHRHPPLPTAPPPALFNQPTAPRCPLPGGRTSRCGRARTGGWPWL
jgi:hypothetical protein